MQRAQFTMQLNDISSICAMCSSTFAFMFSDDSLSHVLLRKTKRRILYEHDFR